MKYIYRKILDEDQAVYEPSTSSPQNDPNQTNSVDNKLRDEHGRFISYPTWLQKLVKDNKLDDNEENQIVSVIYKFMPKDIDLNRLQDIMKFLIVLFKNKNKMILEEYRNEQSFIYNKSLYSNSQAEWAYRFSACYYLKNKATDHYKINDEQKPKIFALLYKKIYTRVNFRKFYTTLLSFLNITVKDNVKIDEAKDELIDNVDMKKLIHFLDSLNAQSESTKVEVKVTELQKDIRSAVKKKYFDTPRGIFGKLAGDNFDGDADFSIKNSIWHFKDGKTSIDDIKEIIEESIRGDENLAQIKQNSFIKEEPYKSLDGVRTDDSTVSETFKSNTSTVLDKLILLTIFQTLIEEIRNDVVSAIDGDENLANAFQEKAYEKKKEIASHLSKAYKQCVNELNDQVANIEKASEYIDQNDDQQKFKKTIEQIQNIQLRHLMKYLATFIFKINEVAEAAKTEVNKKNNV